jgi:HK97 family phage major capsid protein
MNIEYIKSKIKESSELRGNNIKWAHETVVELKQKVEGINDKCDKENRARTDEEKRIQKDAIELVQDLSSKIEEAESRNLDMTMHSGFSHTSENGKTINVYNRDHRPKFEERSDKVDLGRFLQLAATGRSKSDYEERALSEGTDSAGGYTVPSWTSPQLIQGIYNYSTVFEAGAQIVDLSTLTGDTFTYAKVTTSPSISWYGENAAISESDPAFGAVTFSPKKGAFIFYASNELLQDSPNARAKLAEICQRAAAAAIDQGALIGTGTSNQPTGIVNQSGINTVSFGTNGSAPTNYDELVDGYYEIANAKGSLPNSLVMHPRSFRDYAKLKDSQNQPLVKPSVLNDISMFQSQAISTTLDQGTSTGVASEMIMGDFSKLLIGMRLRPVVFADPYSSSNKDQVMFRLTFRMDVQIENPEHFTLLQGILSA